MLMKSLTTNGGHNGYAEQVGNQELSAKEIRAIKWLTLAGLYVSPIGGWVAAAQGYAHDWDD